MKKREKGVEDTAAKEVPHISSKGKKRGKRERAGNGSLLTILYTATGKEKQSNRVGRRKRQPQLFSIGREGKKKAGRKCYTMRHIPVLISFLKPP